ncbi:MAG: M23 family metallopeptidase [Bacteroidales bacterium]|nr:M23 family metallopeptidase [Bacteroidales bacterium]MDD3166535.1 M23 family metallopeptidase [Bacteroidales bacterium]MDD4771010.1 M23 family metallopeptidase [Bacteroidales bacterium]HKL92809.1 M23 family metallopeptidase [Bacteroidales bacterium]
MILKKTLIVLPFLLSGFCLSAQDRYAATISYDKKVAALDSVIMEQLLQEEEEEGDLYEGLYESWSDTKVNPYGVDVRSIKDSFAIDCSGYYPPSLGKVTSHFGPRRRSFHNGIDLKVQVGDTIRAAFDGVVRVRRYNKGGYGYFLVLRHKDGLETVYGHLSRFLVASNDAIKAGDPIALGGNTGRSTGPHLHFEVRFLGNPINPAKMFSFEDYLPLKEAYYVVRDETFEERLRYMGVRVKNASGKYANVDYYTVRKGDVLGRIASRNGISLSKLCQLNNIKSNSVIRPGQRLRLS